MNSNELATAIQKHSKELDALIASSYQDGISAIQHELIKQKCIALYDLLLQVTPAVVVQEKKPIVTTHLETTQELQPPVTLFTAPVSLVNDIPEKSVVTVKKESIHIEETPAVEEKTETEIQNEIIDEIIEQQQEELIVEPIPLLKEVISELSLHEKIASALPPQPDLTERIVSNIGSLKSAINVNLKIALVNELFNESSVEYVKAIDKLNNSENIHEAMRYFTELKHTYNWESDHALVKELETLITKRFTA
ncbi:MAG: hypothetical protein V4651_13625 [Bacteroidota bacterium]